MTNISEEESRIIRQILEHIKAGTTDMLDEVSFNPVANYACPDRARKESEILFRQFPIIVGHAEQVRRPGQFLTHNDTGIPILVVRSRSGDLKAFLNVCRHRGTRIVAAEQGKAVAFSCPYHGWTYDLDGALKSMPHPCGFSSLDTKQHGLKPLPVEERLGLVWVKPQAGGPAPDLDTWLAPMAAQLGSLDLASHTLYKSWSVEKNMSWRFALEGFQESYHFCFAHRQSACANYLENQSVFLDLYPHIRHAVPLPKIVELADQDPALWAYRPNFMTQNYIFPCNYIQVMTDHVYIHSIFPTGVGKCVFKCMMLVPEEPQTDKAKRYWDRNYDVVYRVFGEDFEIGEKIQAGLNSGANEHFTFGRFEQGLHYGQRNIDDALAGRLKA